MPIESSTPNAGLDNATIPSPPTVLGESARSRGARKAAETIRRHTAERRSDRLDQLHAQIADGTLVIRQMTAAQREAASHDARRVVARNHTRSRHTSE